MKTFKNTVPIPVEEWTLPEWYEPLRVAVHRVLGEVLVSHRLDELKFIPGVGPNGEAELRVVWLFRGADVRWANRFTYIDEEISTQGIAAYAEWLATTLVRMAREEFEAKRKALKS